MALLFVDGFDHYGTLTQKGWIKEHASFGEISTTQYRSGTRSVKWTSAGYWIGLALNPGNRWCIVGCALYLPSYPSTTRTLFSIGDGSVEHVTIAVSPQGEVLIRRGTSTTLATSSSKGLVQVNRWQFWEAEVAVEDSTGQAEVWIDGTSVVSYGPGDTRNAGIDGWSQIRFGSIVSDMYMDDVYVCDGTGGTNNAPLGDSTVWTLVPSTGNGANTDWTPSTGVDHGALVDDVPASMTDYNASDTLDEIDTYVVPDNVPTGATVFGVQYNLFLQKDGAGAIEVAPVARIGGTDYAGTGAAVSSSAAFNLEVAEVSPDSSVAWTAAEVNGAEFGAKVTSA